jgi:DHA2 family multidrug resistance protein-like MFS transporter
MELGGALGIAILGSVLSAYYRSDLTLPKGLTSEQAGAARESVSGGVETGRHMTGGLGHQLVDAAREAFTHSLHTTTLIGGALMLAGAVTALVTLRNVPAVLTDPAPDAA